MPKRNMAASFLANPTATKEVLRREGISLTHALGQNFLISDATIQHILDVAQLSPQDTVLEIGPGIGTLTVALLPHVQHLIAIERDVSLLPALEQNVHKALLQETQEVEQNTPHTGDAPTKDIERGTAHFREGLPKDLEKFTLRSEDALTTDYAQLAHLAEESAAPITKLVANLPYQIAASVVLEVFQSVATLSSATIMVQKEVADRMRAAPGSKIYGAYTVKLSLWASVMDTFFVSRNNFLPPPHVDSVVVHLAATPASELAQTLTPEERRHVAQFVEGAFSQRRKKMINALCASGYDKEKVLHAMERLDLDSSIRAEKLTTDDFIRLLSCLKSLS